MKTAMHEMKNTLDRINSRLKIIEGKNKKIGKHQYGLFK